MTIVFCPACKKPSEYSPENKWRPFCSERCKLIDLGEWASEKHAIPCEEETQMSEQFDQSLKTDI
jgi:uncharacterized protein